MRIIGCLLVIGILFSYVPVFSMDGCPEGNHMGDMKVDCGYILPLSNDFDVIVPETLVYPVMAVWSCHTILEVDEVPHLIFHPPN